MSTVGICTGEQMSLWRVVFDHNSAVLVQALSSTSASIEARIGIWILTGKWLQVERVEAA